VELESLCNLFSYNIVMDDNYLAPMFVSLAPTGIVPTKKMTPYVPVTPEEIIKDVTACYRIGISSVHLHARDGHQSSTASKDVFARIIDGIRDECPDLIIGVSCSGRNHSDIKARTSVLELKGDQKPDMASLTLSSLNFPKQASINDPHTIKEMSLLMLERGIKPELEVFDLGMINYAKYLIHKGLLNPPYYFNIILGSLAGAQANVLTTGMMIHDLPEESIWSLAGIGNYHLKMNMLGVIEGGGVRVGLEDMIYFDNSRKRLATNQQLLERIVYIAELTGRRVMTPSEARIRLALNP